MAKPCDERKLVAEVRAGSREAFERLLDMHQDRVYNLALRMVGPADAEDVAQEALIQVYNSIHTFGGRSSLGTWIHRVAVNTCLMHRRKRRSDSAPVELEILELEPDPEADPGNVMLRTETRGRIDDAIASLSDAHRDVVVLHELQGLTYRECAEALGCPVGTVKSRLSNAFGKLRELLQDYAYEGGAAK